MSGAPSESRESSAASRAQALARFESAARSAVESRRLPALLALTAGRETYSFSATPPGGELLSEDTVVWYASLSKTFTALAALRLVDAGLLDLDAPITDVTHLREVRILTGYDASGARYAVPRTPISARMLLTHTAGFGYDFLESRLGRYAREHAVPSRASSRAASLELPLIAEPGTQWNYGIGIDLLGVVLEARCGETLERILRTWVLDPLGLDSVRFGPHGPAAPMHSRTRYEDGSARLAPLDLRYPDDPEQAAGGGGLYGTPRDFLRLLRALLADSAPQRSNSPGSPAPHSADSGSPALGSPGITGAPLLSPVLSAEARRAQLPASWVSPRRSALPASTEDWDFIPEQGDNWSLLGMTNTRTGPHGRAPGGLMWAGLCNSYFWVDWENRDCGALFTQMLPFADPCALELFSLLEATIPRT
ncbi:serine hydrolase domain-containing protein [Brevibacterium sp. NPDC049920]|uniref:serine hydrolase domain-containing protein n=1 Tax=Brevibacterium sp. NPDC049920 TaxID=3155279 RepID=UPI0034043898